MVIMGALLVGSLAGCGLRAVLPEQGYGMALGYGMAQGYGMVQDHGTAQGEAPLAQVSCEASTLAAYAVDSGESWTDEDACRERFKIYESFGMTYDAGGNELYYNGKAVRWFEDYYLVGDDPQAQAGRDFFNENGVVDVYAVRDFGSFQRAADGSYDPSGKLVGLREFTEEEFVARDVEAIKNPRPVTAVCGSVASAEEMQEMAREYEDFGLTYDAKADQWYLGGEKVRYFRDILTSNGESLGSGRFRGAIRSFGSEDGTVDVYMIRDYGKVNALGYGTLKGIETVEVTGQLPGGRVNYTVYEPYGLTFDEKTNCYTYNGSVVRFFNDPAVGAGFTNFITGTVDIEAKRDGNNMLIGIMECSQEVYDYHTQKYNKFYNSLMGPNTVMENGTGQNVCQ